MKVFTSKDFKGHYPVGSAAVVVAETEQQARVILDASLAANGLPQKSQYTLQELPLDKHGVLILCDGNY